MRKFTEYIGGQFGNPTGMIGKLCCVIMNIINKPMYVKTIDLLKVEAGSDTLDIGYGNGFLLKRLYKVKRTNMYGIDISEDMMEAAKKRNQKADTDGRLHLTIGDCCDLQYEEEKFESVTSINTIYFWRDTLKGLKEIHRVLKVNSSFYNVVYTKEWLRKLSYTKKGFKLFSEEDFKSLGKQAGFQNVEIQEIVKGRSFVVIYTK